MTPRRPEDTPRSLRDALRALPRPAADAGFTARVLARLDETSEPVRPARRPRSAGRHSTAWLSTAWLLGGLATAALALAVGWAVLGPARERPAAAGAIASAAPPRVAEAPDPPSVERTAPAPAAETRRAAPEHAATASPPAALAAVPSPSPSSSPPSSPSSSPSSSPGPAVAVPASDPLPAARRRALLAEVRSELDALRQEHRQLTAGLADLPEIGADGRPVLYVGGDEELGLVVGAASSASAATYPGGGASL